MQQGLNALKAGEIRREISACAGFHFRQWRLVSYAGRRPNFPLGVGKSVRRNSRLLWSTPTANRHNLAGFNNAQPADTPLNLIKVGQRETATLTRARALPVRRPSEGGHRFQLIKSETALINKRAKGPSLRTALPPLLRNEKHRRFRPSRKLSRRIIPSDRTEGMSRREAIRLLSTPRIFHQYARALQLPPRCRRCRRRRRRRLTSIKRKSAE